MIKKFMKRKVYRFNLYSVTEDVTVCGDKSLRENLLDADSEVVMKIYCVPTLDKNYFREIVTGIKIPARTDYIELSEDLTPYGRNVNIVKSPVYICSEEKEKATEDDLILYLAADKYCASIKDRLLGCFFNGFKRYIDAYEKQMEPIQKKIKIINKKA